MRRRGWLRTGKGGGAGGRLDELEAAVDRLREVAETGTVVVEGARDLKALEWLGIGGHHVVLHQGEPMARLYEELVQSPAPIVLLLDWDRTGGRLVRALEENLRARIQIDVACRRRFAHVCAGKTFEEVPAELSALRSAP